MADTGAMIGYGAKFAINITGGNSPDEYDEIAEVFNLSPPSDTIDVVDATHMQSPNATREFILGLNDPGECSFEMNFIPGSDADDTIQALRLARTRVYCKITYPNEVTWTFIGILTGYEPSAPTDDRMTATVTFKVSGSYVTGTDSP